MERENQTYIMFAIMINFFVRLFTLLADPKFVAPSLGLRCKGSNITGAAIFGALQYYRFTLLLE